MTPATMREAKKELHNTIIDTICFYNPTDDEMKTLLEYVKTLATNELKEFEKGA